MTSVLIAICTCQREALLLRCLESLESMQLPDGLECTVLVVDNDPAAGARESVERQQASSPFPMLFHHEPRRGIPLARNAAIAVFLERDLDRLVFIDDDEWVDPAWLRHLVACGESNGGQSVISGRVCEHFPEGTPDYIGRLYARKSRPSGTRLYTCATNNVSIPRFAMSELGLRFDESVPLAGGTDTLFFQSASEQGVEILYCAEAIVHESIPASRANLRWLSRRKYRVGITDARKKTTMGRSRVGLMVSSTGMLAVELLKSVLATLMLSRYQAGQYWLRACKQLGVICGLMGRQVESYKQIDQ